MRFNTDLRPLDSMEEVEAEEAEKMKNFLKHLSLAPSNASGIGLDSVQQDIESMPNRVSLENQQLSGDMPMHSQSAIGGDDDGGAHRSGLDVVGSQVSSHRQGQGLSTEEKKRIGKVYARDAPLDSVVATEMSRI